MYMCIYDISLRSKLVLVVRLRTLHYSHVLSFLNTRSSGKPNILLSKLCAHFLKVCFARMLLLSDLRSGCEAVSGVTRKYESIAVDIGAVLTCGSW
jgi:hypothetical protein